MSLLHRLYCKLRPTGPRWRGRIIFDFCIAVGNFHSPNAEYPTHLDKEEISRRYVFSRAKGTGIKGRFLDVGGRDGKLSYLLGHVAPLAFRQEVYDSNKSRFDAAFDYYGLDLYPAGENVLSGDLCDPAFLEKYRHMQDSFDVVYSNNVFEHFERPWIAAQNLLALMKVGGICITIVPFSIRYHEAPGDYYRFTHTGISKLFEFAGKIKVIEAGFDIRARRYDWQGLSKSNDNVPVDRYGAWRETWFTVVVLEKL